MNDIDSRQKSRRILILADPNSPLAQERGLAGQLGGYTIYWYSIRSRANIKGVAKIFTPWTFRIKRPTRLRFLLYFLHLKRTIKSLQPDIIHVHFALQYGWNNLALLHFKPLVVTVMGSDILLPGQDFHLVKRLLDHADIITSKSQFLDSALNKVGDYAHKIRRVTWGVDMQKFQPDLDVQCLRLRWGIQPDQFVFFSPRLCRPLYNQHIIIEAFAVYLHQSNSKAILLIAELFGDEIYCRRLKKLIAELKLNEQVRLVGSIPHKEMPDYLNLADVVISIPSSDGMPQTLYESMACKAYPILGDLSSYKEIIQSGINGHLVPVDNVEALAEAMIWVTEHPDHLKKTGDLNYNYVVKIADKAEQTCLVNKIYDELFSRYDLETGW